MHCPNLRRLIAIVLSSVLLAWGSPTAAQTTPGCPPAAQHLTPEQVVDGMKSGRDRGFLWRLLKDGRTSYLYGTVHVAQVDWMFPGATLLEAVRSSDVVALELDMLDPDIAQRLRAGMSPRPGQALPGALTGRLRAQVKAACLPEQLMSALSPEMVATTLVVMSGLRDGLDPVYVIDGFYAGRARGMKKTVLSLESPEMQLAILQGRTAQETQALVEQALDGLEARKASPMLMRIAQIWAAGRFSELDRYEQWCECLNSDSDRTFHKRMLDERNPALAERIDALHAGGRKVFAAVGSLHMIGASGLPGLMAQRGYRVERVELRP